MLAFNHHLGYNWFMLYTILLNLQNHMANTPTTVNHSDLPCTCTSLEAYVDGLCPGCTEAADRDADLKEHVDAQGSSAEEPREGDDDRFYSGTGESMDDESYERYLNR